MLHRIEDLNARDLHTRINSPYWTHEEIQEAVQEQAQRRFNRLNELPDPMINITNIVT